MNAITAIGVGAVVVVAIGWLIVSFSPPSPRREVVEWLSAAGLYAALLMLFVNLLLRAWSAGSTAGLIAFGFLALLFAGGALVSLVQTVLALREPRKTQITTGATN